MKNQLYILFFLLIGSLATGCKRNQVQPAPTASSQTDLLVTNRWKLDNITTPAGAPISRTQLGVSSLVLYEVEIQFLRNNTARALRLQDRQIINGGTWKLTNDNQGLDVDVSAFKGVFPIVNLSRNRMTLRNRVPVNGTEVDANLVFVPSI